jgi:hypothetical protein
LDRSSLKPNEQADGGAEKPGGGWDGNNSDIATCDRPDAVSQVGAIEGLAVGFSHIVLAIKTKVLSPSTLALSA